MTSVQAAARNLFEQFQGRLIVALALVVGLYFVVGFGGQAWKARQLHAELAQQQAIVDKLQAQHATLQQQAQDDSSPKYLSDVEISARRDLNLSHPGETVLLVRWVGESGAPVPGPATTPQVKPATTAEPTWHKWLDLFHQH